MKYLATALGVIMSRGDILIAVVAFPIAAAWAQSASPRLMKPESDPKTTDQAYKNIQVLKDLPADQLIPAMQFVASSLGVECEFCHVESAFDKDEKKPKQTARKMMRMMFAINKDNFDGHREVTCYSCHRGARKPVGIPIIGDEEPKIEVAMDMTSEETSAATPDVASPGCGSDSREARTGARRRGRNPQGIQPDREGHDHSLRWASVPGGSLHKSSG